MTASIVLAGGGTAGHVNPLLATAAELISRGHRVTALGTSEGLEADLVPRAGVDLRMIPRVPMPRRPSGDMARLPGNLRSAIAAARATLSDVSADAVVGFGGYVSTPAYFAARRAGVPIIVHEANARPGMANKLGARMTRHVAITFPGTPLPRAVVTGLPLRPEIAELSCVLNDAVARGEAQGLARMRIGWPADAPTLLVMGGSLGAASLNAAMERSIATLLGHGVHVIHLTGRGKAEGAERAKGDLAAAVRDQYVVQEYAHDMASAFAAADAIACRSGAATVAEVTALGIPALYVPLPYGNGEQALNALPSTRVGAASIIADVDLSPAAFEQAVEEMVLDPATRNRMREAAATVGISDGAGRLADMIEGALT